MHYCARAGNADIMLEIVKDLGPNRIQGAVNKQAKVSRVHLHFESFCKVQVSHDCV